ncbi:hypothetical protein RHSP_31816 [Rhizobium freirei PRF 81]|uniref:GcrA cell cycle regulator n=1 Tax=Rhizobium freirei PRF 81 TaxID=363754 RepID=N6U068_9HYPH|nr:GcrA family cell cycle regulator [Rhizobium freirei]ENN86044.1 hypothetical protein RHSP_31816 [Rhizobium freirei PRF 81]
MTINYSNWTVEAKERASKLWADGLSVAQIAARLNVQLGSISGLMTRNRNMFPKRGGAGKSAYVQINAPTLNGKSTWTEEQLQTAIDLWNRNLTTEEIGATIGKSSNAVQKKAHANRDMFPCRDLRGTGNRGIVDRVGLQRAKRERHAQGLPAEPPPLPHHGYNTAVFALPGASPVRLLDLTEKHCRWPITCDESPKGANTPFCGANRTHGSYCAAHAMIARGRGTTSERNALNGIGGRK